MSNSRITPRRSLVATAALALTLTGLGLAQPALAAGESVSVTPTSPVAGQSSTRDIVLNATVDLPDGATGGVATWSVKIGGSTKIVPAETFTIAPGATSIAITPATISGLPRGGVSLEYTLDDGTVITDSGSEAFNDMDWGGSGGTVGCQSPGIVITVKKTDPSGSPLEGAGFTVSAPETPTRLAIDSGGIVFASLTYDVASFLPVASDAASWPTPLGATPVTIADGTTEVVLADSKFTADPCAVFIEGLASGNGDLAVSSESVTPEGYLPVEDFTLTASGSANTEPLPSGMNRLVLGSDFKVSEDSGAVEITSQAWDEAAGVYRVEMTVVDQPVEVPPVDPPADPPVVTPPPIVIPPAPVEITFTTMPPPVAVVPHVAE